jgi:hypothetical protein
MGVGEEESGGVEDVARSRHRTVLDIRLGAELHNHPAGEGGVGEDVVVGHQQPRRHQEPGSQWCFAAVVRQGDPRDRRGGAGAPDEEAGRLEVVGRADDALQRDASVGDAGRRREVQDGFDRRLALANQPPGAGLQLLRRVVHRDARKCPGLAVRLALRRRLLVPITRLVGLPFSCRLELLERAHGAPPVLVRGPVQ